MVNLRGVIGPHQSRNSEHRFVQVTEEVGLEPRAPNHARKACQCCKGKEMRRADFVKVAMDAGASPTLENERRKVPSKTAPAHRAREREGHRYKAGTFQFLLCNRLG